MPRIMLEIVEQHAEEAAFLWLLRNEATHAPHYRLEQLAELDERVGAHLDGLRIAGDEGWEIVRHQLEWREPGEVFAAAHVALQSQDRRRIVEVLDVATASTELARGFVSALGWFPYAVVQPYVESLVTSQAPVARRIGIGAAGVHRRDLGSRLEQAVAHDQLTVRSRALKAAAELGRRDLLPYCREDLGAELDEARYWSAWSTVLLGDREATKALWDIADDGGPLSEPACDLAARCARHGEARAWQRRLATRRERGQLAIVAARALGDPALVPWLLDVMTVDEFARPAAEAFSFITGVDLGAAKLSRKRPNRIAGGPTDDPHDENVAMDPDEDLPWPEPRAIIRWWSEHDAEFTPGVRYLAGRPIRLDAMREVLVWGTQRQRGAAALELVLLQPGEPLFEVRARGDEQRRALWQRPGEAPE